MPRPVPPSNHQGGFPIAPCDCGLCRQTVRFPKSPPFGGGSTHLTQGIPTMSQCISQTRRRLLVYLAVAGLLLFARQAPAEPVPGKHDRLVAQMVCYYLQNLHLRKPDIGEEVSKRLFNRFLKTLDPAKLYFQKSDIDEFKATEGELGAKLLQGDMTFAYKVYERFAARVAERVKLIEELVKAPHDYTVKESMSTDYDALDFANTADELRERWRKRIKFDLLQQRLDKK